MKATVGNLREMIKNLPDSANIVVIDEFNSTTDLPVTIFSLYRWCEQRL